MVVLRFVTAELLAVFHLSSIPALGGGGGYRVGEAQEVGGDPGLMIALANPDGLIGVYSVYRRSFFSRWVLCSNG